MATATISDFIDKSTGLLAGLPKVQAALTSGDYTGLTPVDADLNPLPANTPLDATLLSARLRGSAASNLLLWGALAAGAWYLFLRRK